MKKIDINSGPFFEEIFQESHVPCVILGADSPDFTIIEVNRGFLELSRRRKEEVIDKGFFECGAHPAMALNTEMMAAAREALDQVVRDKRFVRSPIQPYKRPPSDGEPSPLYYLQATNKPVLDETNEIKYIIRTIKDVTESVTAQLREHEINEILRDNDEFLRETQRAAKIGSWQIDRNNVVRWSEIHHEIFETEEGFQPTVENSLGFLNERDRDRLGRIFKEAQTTGKAFDEEFEITTAKGNLRWLRFSGKGEVRDGEFVRLYGIAQDISAHKTLELRLLESRNHFENIIHNIQGVVWEADARTLQITFISDKLFEMLGYTSQECLCSPGFWHSHLHPDDKAKVISQTKAKVKACENFSFEYRMIKKDGSYIWVLDSFTVACENGQPKQLRGLMIDITKTKITTELEHLERMVLELNSSARASLDKVLEFYLQGIEAMFPQMVCSIMKVKNGYVQNWVSPSLSPGFKSAIDKAPIGERAGSCGTAAFRRETVIVSDIATDPLWENYRDLALKEGLHASWSHPIFSSDGEVLATLAMYYRKIMVPTEDELKVVARTAAILTVIIENSQNSKLLEETNSLMKQSQELARFGSLQWDIPVDELIWSTEMRQIFGISPDTEITLERHFDWVHPDDRERVRQELDDALSSKEDHVFEERIIRPSGEIRYLKTWVRVTTDERGEPIKVIGASLDITGSKEAEKRLIASEQHLRHILDSQTNYVVRIGLDFKYRYTNKKFIEDFALKGEKDLVGTDSLRAINEEQVEDAKKVIRECIAHPGHIISIELEKLTIRNSNKATFWHFICLTDAEGNPQEIQGIGIDISERKKAEKERMLKTLELEASEKRYSDLFHLSPQPMYVYDTASLKFLDVNAAAIKQYGYSREEFLSITILDIRPEEEVSNLINELETVKKNGVDFYRGTYIQKAKHGEILHVELHSNLISYEGKTARLVLAGNITDRVKYLERLKAQNKNLREIAWTQSHVVRAPLARIMALIHMIKNYPEMNGDNEELLGHIFTSAVELDEVIRDITRKAEEVNLDDYD